MFAAMVDIAKTYVGPLKVGFRPSITLVNWMVLLALFAVTASPAMLWIWGEIDSAGRAGLLIGGLSLGILSHVKFGWPVRALSWQALGLIVLAALLSRVSFNILQQLSASFALIGLYGFSQAFSRLPEGLWRQGFIMAGLAALAIPFALVPSTGAGFYLRLLTADVAAQILAIFGHASIGAHDVLIFDNGIAQVDIPCSGLKSLFTGTAFFLAASLVLKRPVSIKWIFGYGNLIFLLLSANILRVTTLIWVSEILEARLLAEQIHTALGLALFALSCLAGVLILRRMPGVRKTLLERSDPTAFTTVTAVIASGILVLAILIVPSQTTAEIGDIDSPDFAALSAVSLTPTETEFFEARGRTTARKWRFEFEGLSGSILVVKSRAANGLHAPEVCFLGNGLTIDQMNSRPWRAGSDLDSMGQYRWLSLNQETYSAAYWMQSEALITDDFRERLGRFILGRHNEWTMVTILFDQSLNPDTDHNNNISADTLRHRLRQFYMTGSSGPLEDMI